MSLVGELNDLGLSDIFQILALSQRTGTLVVTMPNCVGQVLFASGAIVGGGLSPHTPALGEAFVARGALQEALLPTLLSQELRGTQGVAMLQQLGPDPAVFLAAMEEELRRMMALLLQAQEGSFCFENATSIDPWPHFSLAGTMAICPKGLRAQYLAMEAMRLRDEATRAAASGAGAAPQTALAGGRPQQLAQALMGEEGPKEDDWSAVLSEASGPPGPQAAAAAAAAPRVSALACVRDVVLALHTLPKASDPSALLLRALQLHCERGAYFELRGRQLVGRGGFGRAPTGADVGAQVVLAELAIARGGPLVPALQADGASVQPVCAEGGHDDLLRALGGPCPKAQPVLLAPWRVQGRVVGLLVGDNPSGVPLTDAPGIDILLAHTTPAAAPSPIGQ